MQESMGPKEPEAVNFCIAQLQDEQSNYSDNDLR